MNDDFDASLYVRAPVIDVGSGIALGIALLSALPKEAPADVKKSAQKLRKSVITLQGAWEKAGDPIGLRDKRPADQATDNAWSCLHGRLSNYAYLPAAHHPKAARAQAIIDQLFPDGLTFLQLPYATEWAESEKRIARIDKTNLVNDIDVIAGAEFLDEVRRAHAEYGQALGITKAPKSEAPESLAEPLRALAKAIAQYALKLAGLAGDSDDALRMARAALRPIDEHRATTAKRAASGDKGDKAEPSGEAPPPATPSTPVPEVPDA
jgi:hypothetical protein